MPNMNDHIDDLFKKAADGYPLKTPVGDWGKIELLLKNTDVTEIKPVANTNKAKILLVLALCMFTSIILKDGIKNMTSIKKFKHSGFAYKNTTSVNKNSNNPIHNFHELSDSENRKNLQ